jgi:hypothetical protein
MSTTPIRRLRTAALGLTLAVVTSLTVAAAGRPAPAGAGPADPQRTVDAYLAAHPGGTQIGRAAIAYDNGRFIVTVARLDAVAAGQPDCPRGWFCFYERTQYGYPRGQLSDCGWQDLARWNWHDRTASVHFNATGYVVFYNHLGRGTHTGDVALFSLDTAFRADPDVAPYRDIADHVRRYC